MLDAYGCNKLFEIYVLSAFLFWSKRHAFLLPLSLGEKFEASYLTLNGLSIGCVYWWVMGFFSRKKWISGLGTFPLWERKMVCARISTWSAIFEMCIWLARVHLGKNRRWSDDDFSALHNGYGFGLWYDNWLPLKYHSQWCEWYLLVSFSKKWFRWEQINTLEIMCPSSRPLGVARDELLDNSWKKGTWVCLSAYWQQMSQTLEETLWRFYFFFHWF